MTDRPFAGGSTETAAGPAPGYYPDPSIPGFVRYWGGSAWVPGTSRPAPAEGEVLEPPRYATRRPGAAGGGVGARYVPPPAVAGPAEEGEPGVGASGAGPVVTSGGDTGPVYLDQTSGGASFTFAVAESGPVFRPGVLPADEGGPVVAAGGPAPWVSWGVLPGAEGPAAGVAAPEPEPEPERVVEPEAVPVEPSPSRSASPVPEPRAAVEPARAVSVPTRTTAARPTATRAVATREVVGPSAPAPAAVRPAATVRPAAVGRRRAEAARVRPAGLGRRLAARLVDTAVLTVVAVAAGLPLGNSVAAHLQQKLDQARMASKLTRRQVDVWLVDGMVLGKVAVLIGILLFVGVLYEVLPTARTGQTFGKRLARIRVVPAAPPAGPSTVPSGAPSARLGFGRSLLRWLVRHVSTVLLVGLLRPLFDRPDRRGWHDRAARTRVVRL